MDKKKVKVYTYTRVSTTMQIDGYSLDAQKSRMKENMRMPVSPENPLKAEYSFPK